MNKIGEWLIRRKIRKMGEKAIKEGTMFGKVWSWLNGKKTVLGAVLIAAPVLIAQGASLAQSFGVDGAQLTEMTGAAIAAVGLAHKVYKITFGQEPQGPAK